MNPEQEQTPSQDSGATPNVTPTTPPQPSNSEQQTPQQAATEPIQQVDVAQNAPQNTPTEAIYTPPNTTPPAPDTAMFQAGATTATTEHGADVVGILSIVFAFISPLIGIILGVVGLKKAKSEGRKSSLSRIGIIISCVFMFLFIPLIMLGVILNNFQGAQGKARDTERVTDVNTIFSKLEEYRNSNGSYPSEIDATILAPIGAQALTDPGGVTIAVSEPVKNLEEALGSFNPRSQANYSYVPYGCNKTICSGYVIKTYIERPNITTINPYVKQNL